jgi:predicted RNA-binding Zn-ribbon protein involved in translation (DUF1610 family)
MTDRYDGFTFTCPDCGEDVISTDTERAYGLSIWRCPKGHWSGNTPCGPYGHEESDSPGLEGRCRYCHQNMQSDDDE